MPLVLRQHRIIVATAGTPKELALTPIKTPSAVVIGDPNNAGQIHIGDADVDSSTELGAPIGPGENVELKGVEYNSTSEEIQLRSIFVDADNDGDSAIVSYYDRIPDIIDDFTNTKSLLYDGVDEFLTVGTDSSLNLPTALTVSSWIKSADLGASQAAVSKWNGFTDERIWFVGVTAVASSKLRILISDVGTGTGKDYRSSVTVYDGAWHHVAFTFFSDTLKLYIDGIEDTSVTKTTDNTVNTLFSANPEGLIGSFIDNAGAKAQFFTGNIDEVSIWNKALSSAEISEIHNAGDPTNLGAHSAFANLVSWWRMGDGDTFPTIKDQVGVNNGTMTNMEAGDIVTDSP